MFKMFQNLIIIIGINLTIAIDGFTFLEKKLTMPHVIKVFFLIQLGISFQDLKSQNGLLLVTVIISMKYENTKYLFKCASLRKHFSYVSP